MKSSRKWAEFWSEKADEYNVADFDCKLHNQSSYKPPCPAVSLSGFLHMQILIMSVGQSGIIHHSYLGVICTMHANVSLSPKMWGEILSEVTISYRMRRNIYTVLQMFRQFCLFKLADCTRSMRTNEILKTEIGLDTNFVTLV